MTLDGLQVLGVEDEPVIALALEDLLLDLGATPTLAGNADEAFALTDRRGFDAAILDVNLHGVRSYALAERLLALAIPFIFATGYGNATHPDRLRHVPTVTKPYDIGDIRDAFARLGVDGPTA